ncbi:YihY/virulence factor BrkB family protein [Microbacterium sp. NPDC058342]|uniref:YihY/virulence factor BrkB family protein n=1 Tax=Microbacterium sp. NPDC058342 TaxID=3346454 RepID=UPI00364F2D96
MRARLTRSAGRAVVLARRTTRLLPIRVWRRFLRRNGFLLSAGMAYQALFALFALLYAAFAVAGIWVGGSGPAIDALIRVANSYLPGVISDAGTGLATVEQVHEVAASTAGAFTVTGLIAMAVVLWTAIGAVTFTRRAVRDVFGLPFDPRGYLLLKVRDAAAALAFGIALLAGAALSVGGVWALTQLFDLLGWQMPDGAYPALVRGSSVLVIVAIDIAAIALLVRFLTGTSIRWRTIWPGAALGGTAVAALQLGAGLLFAHTPGNPLLAAFAVMVALLLWCRLVAAVILLSATWIAIGAHDRGEPLERPGAGAHRAARRVGGPR